MHMRSFIQRARVAVLKPLTQYDALARLMFDIKLLLLSLRRRDLVLLITTTKTGTHYLRFLLAYYILLLEAKENGGSVEVDHGLVDRFFPNSWHTSYTGVLPRIAPDPRIKKLGIVDIPRSHMPLRVAPWCKTRIIHTYRDLDDQAVVSWFTKYACDHRLSSEFSTIQDLMDVTRDANQLQLDSFKNNGRNRINCLRLSFESIHQKPEKCLALVISWLGLEPNLALCKEAAFLTRQTPSVLVGGGEKWHRFPSQHIDQKILNEFIAEYTQTGAIGVAKVLGVQK